jgi:hypothetical protein
LYVLQSAFGAQELLVDVETKLTLAADLAAVAEEFGLAAGELAADDEFKPIEKIAIAASTQVRLRIFNIAASVIKGCRIL